MFEFFNGSSHHANHQGVAARHVVTLARLFTSLDKGHETAVLFPIASHADEGGNRESKAFRIDIGMVTANDSGLFEIA